MKTEFIFHRQLFNIIKNLLFAVLGILSAGFGLKSFLIPNGFIDGGITGLSLLVSVLTSIPFYILLIAINIPFIFLAIKHVSKIFALNTLLAIIGLSLCLVIIPYPVITSDKLLVAIFGGFFLGAGIGLSIRGGNVIDGTEVLAIYLNKKIGLSVGDTILLINIIIFSLAALLINIEIALYSLLTYLSASKTVDFIVHGIEEYIGITIISNKNEEIRKRIIQKFGKGVTIYRGEGGYDDKLENKNINILFTVVTILEVVRLKNEILSIDPSAFIMEQKLKDVKGGVIKKRPLH